VGVTYDGVVPLACLGACPATVGRTMGFQYVSVGFGNDNREREIGQRGKERCEV